MSGKGHKSGFRILPESTLPPDVREALRTAKRSGNRLRTFENNEHKLPEPQQGYQYKEIQVGHANPGDSRPPGKRRLVLEVHEGTGRVGEKYFSDGHYTRGVFCRIR